MLDVSNNQFSGPYPTITMVNSATTSYGDNYWASRINWTSSNFIQTVQAGTTLSTLPVLQYTNFLNYSLGGVSNSVLLYSDTACSAWVATFPQGSTANTNSTGYVKFTSFIINLTGNFYIMVSNSHANSTCSGPLVVTPSTPKSLIYTIPPTGLATAGSIFSTQPALIVYDVYGNVVPGATVVLSPFINLACTVSGLGPLIFASGVASSSGAVAFTSLSYQHAQNIYILATSGMARLT